MRVNVRYAVVWFTVDLTDPRTARHPIALICVGEAGALPGFHLIATTREIGGLDPDARRLLQDFPPALEKIVDAGLREAGVDGLLDWLEPRLRHTFALGKSHSAVIDLDTETPRLDRMLAALLPLYERKVSSNGAASAFSSMRFETIDAQV